ncbi:metallophosphoesterase family protein [Adhaeribacter rhizoryzae]|uniref:Metallophosphoesterase n=1 Tax=Adhaeribacter rhizoryzae TaxID=2607907 RepID=A0A5M6DFT5_9BACT|nr:metallophosphoesterase [Adhaeribacter rhizoryzae]KAA5546391.1 metallophosphoesterase [Adhaeribacter rhizoryzae]
MEIIEGGNSQKKTRIAAVGDIHVKETDHGKWTEYFKNVGREADILILAGDLTDTGHLNEAEILKEELKACSIPIVAVLGNHDFERDQQKAIKKMLESDQVHILDGEAVVINNIGFAGIKGFGGGFGRYMLSMFGEQMFKSFVQEAVDEALKLDRALAHLESNYEEDLKKFVVMHYAPIKETVEGEPHEIWPFMGSSRLVEPINRREVEAVFHGHAHVGTLEGQTSAGVKVYNVARPILQRAHQLQHYIYEV